MKKIIGISLVAMLMAMPMIAGAAPVAGEPVAGNADSPTASAAPKYALKGAGDNDTNAVSAGYVKGAYNALIKGINKTHDEVGTLNTGIETYADAIEDLTTGKATQSGTVATIKKATTTESIATSSVNINNVTTTSISATASGTVNMSVPVLADWNSDNVSSNPIQTTTSFSGLAVDGLTMSAPGANNTAALTKSGIGGTVDVLEYLASAGFDFTQLINVNGNSYDSKGIDGSVGYNGGGFGLSNGEWRATWDAYGTVKGIAQCSSTGNNGEFDRGATTSSISTTGDTKTCWCKLTGWTPNGGTETPISSFWAFNGTPPYASHCAQICASECSRLVRDNSGLRSGLFGSVQQ